MGLLSIPSEVEISHDTGASGWCALIIVIPLFGIAVLLKLLGERGDSGANRGLAGFPWARPANSAAQWPAGMCRASAPGNTR